MKYFFILLLVFSSIICSFAYTKNQPTPPNNQLSRDDGENQITSPARKQTVF